jgi:hypothetical protein
MTGIVILMLIDLILVAIGFGIAIIGGMADEDGVLLFGKIWISFFKFLFLVLVMIGFALL